MIPSKLKMKSGSLTQLPKVSGNKRSSSSSSSVSKKPKLVQSPLNSAGFELIPRKPLSRSSSFSNPDTLPLIPEQLPTVDEHYTDDTAAVSPSKGSIRHNNLNQALHAFASTADSTVKRSGDDELVGSLFKLGYRNIARVAEVVQQSSPLDLTEVTAKLKDGCVVKYDPIMQLNKMGFFDCDLCVKLLVQNKGDLTETVHSLQQLRLRNMNTVPAYYEVSADGNDTELRLHSWRDTMKDSLTLKQKKRIKGLCLPTPKTRIARCLLQPKLFSTKFKLPVFSIPHIASAVNSSQSDSSCSFTDYVNRDTLVWSTAAFLDSESVQERMDFLFKGRTSSNVAIRFAKDYKLWNEHRLLLDGFIRRSTQLPDLFHKEVLYIASYQKDAIKYPELETNLILAVCDVLGRPPSIVRTAWIVEESRSFDENDSLENVLEDFIRIFNQLVKSNKIKFGRLIGKDEIDIKLLFTEKEFAKKMELSSISWAKELRAQLLNCLENAEHFSTLQTFVEQLNGVSKKSTDSTTRMGKVWNVAEADLPAYTQDWIEISEMRFHKSTEACRNYQAEFTPFCNESTCPGGVCGKNCPCVCNHSRFFYDEKRSLRPIPANALSQQQLELESNSIFECNHLCSCNRKPKFCPHRLVQFHPENPNIRFEVYRTKNIGWALRSLVAIPVVGTYVAEYMGELINEDEASIREIELRSMSACNYLWTQHGGNDIASTIDAQKYGTISRFINHSCDPNMSAYIVRIGCVDDRLLRIAFFTTKPIKKGDELTIDYNWPQAKEFKEGVLKCSCGARNCRGLFQLY
jgi:hypothetical protein